MVPRSNIEKEVSTLVKYLQQDAIARVENPGKLHSHLDYLAATSPKSKMLTLAAKNFDHFQPQEEKAYLVGHQLVIEAAQNAAKKVNVEKKAQLLIEAYSIDAFTCHFLTDCFSSGHIRFDIIFFKYR